MCRRLTRQLEERVSWTPGSFDHCPRDRFCNTPSLSLTRRVPYQIRTKIFVATTHALKPLKVVSARATPEGTGVIATRIFENLKVRISLWELTREAQTKQREPLHFYENMENFLNLKP